MWSAKNAATLPNTIAVTSYKQAPSSEASGAHPHTDRNGPPAGEKRHLRLPQCRPWLRSWLQRQKRRTVAGPPLSDLIKVN